MNTETGTCKVCGHTIAHVFDKAPGGASALVWADSVGDWICEPTGDEHVPDGPDSTFQSDLDTLTEGEHASALLDDSIFNGYVDGMERLGHSRARTEHVLRDWILYSDDEESEENPMDPVEAVTYAILAINTDQEPTATSGNDLLYLECNAERALAALARIRDYLIASGEDLPDYVTGKDES